ncbi:sensor histidine kinase [Sphingomonas montana]|uniref:sensor histidine kinase n=1 Tax=Sphingomonas montana TaxID=1843236 RepID=UPI00096D7CB6|nr:ATP-binding protein [Sphingomonas montana]
MDRIAELGLAEPPARPKGTRFLLAAVIATLLLVLGGLGIGSEYNRTLNARAKLVLAYQRRIVVADLLAQLKDADTARRGHAITGDPAFLLPYRPAVAAIARQRRALEARLIDVPQQAARYADLGRAIDARLDELRHTPATNAARNVGSGGQATMARVQAIGAAMMAEEDRMIDRRIAMHASRVASVKQHLVLSVAVLALLAALALAREWRGRRSRYTLARKAQAAEMRLRGVFAATSDAVALIDEDGVIQAVNPAVEQLVGRRPEALVGRDISVLVDVVPAEGPFFRRLGVADGRLREPFRTDRVAHHVDGHGVPVDVALGLMPVAGGVHVVAAIRDISERKSVERIKDEFVATVSHELRTPLTSIVGALGLLRATAGATLPEAARRLVRVAEENSQRLIDLINDLLDIERMEVGGLRFRDDPLDLADMLRRVVDGNEALATVRDVRIELAIASGDIAVRGDEGRLAQVTTNLLANAIRFSAPGQTVTITAERLQGRAMVTVDDRGPGVPDAFRERLFTRFAQSESGGRAGGTGLGLAISRQIMRAHGGTIWFEPRPGGGARFGFAIDLRDGSSETPHLLICADDAAVVCGLRRLADAGACSADRVATVEDAHAAIRSGTYDAILIDLDGDNSTGARLLAGLSDGAGERRLPVPVVARTGGTVWLGAHQGDGSWQALDATDGALAAQVRALLDGIGAARPLILHIDADVATIGRTAGALQRRARLRRASDLATATALLDRERPVLLILDQDLLDGPIAALLSRVAREGRHKAGARVATILYTGRPVSRQLEGLVDCVVSKSQRSSPNLIAAVDRLLARAGVEAASCEAEDDGAAERSTFNDAERVGVGAARVMGAEQ